jgi:competence ComEA-like helix-hairpin-helix protein
MNGREMRAVLFFVLVSFVLGSAYRAWTRGEGPTLVERLRTAAEESRLEAERAGESLVPHPGESPAGGSAAGGGGAARRSPAPGEGGGSRRRATLPIGALDPDRATAEEWERLPGIGPALASRIVADREANGAFGGIEGLLRVRGIGPRTVERLRPYFRTAPVDSGSPIAN